MNNKSVVCVCNEPSWSCWGCEKEGGVDVLLRLMMMMKKLPSYYSYLSPAIPNEVRTCYE